MIKSEDKFIIIEDTREQKPLILNAPFVDFVMREKLDYGDYACIINDKFIPFFFERKSLADLFGTLGAGHKRFKKEINRANDDGNMLFLLIECSYKQVLKGYSRSKMSGLSVMRTLFTYLIKHRVPFVCTGSRDESAMFIQEFYYSYMKNMGDIK